MTSLLFGMQFLPFYGGAFGEKGTLEALMIKSERARIYELAFLKPYFSESLPYSVSLTMYIFVLFLLVLDLLGVFSYILHVYLGYASCAFNEFFFFLLKTKK